ncbi:putative Selectively expressed in embryonic epithelia protein-1 [Paragonimus heterotremus]|uniref:Putative Selectively expressed in embryonic epithelia protein-1 n=1 Tax=Paragonimus heterotremus TaxID=100268 RepID=A0A8J4STX6_9TREM|nr:putative Selectively expressed in embryonic epithelia protein-1 [Paragonimus heterotremus]
MDRFGLRLLKLLAVGMYFVGTLMFAFTKEESSNLLFVAGILVALGCTSSLICNHQISSMFPKFRGFAIALMSGAFDSSTVITFLITKTFPSISLQTSFVVVACCALFYGTMMGLFGLTQWSQDMSNRGMKTDSDGAVDQQGDKHRNGDEEVESGAKCNVDERIQAILENRYPSLRRCIFSWPFFLVTLFFMFGILRFSYFLNQMGQQLTYMFGDDVTTINELRAVSSALQMGGFLVSPISGFVLDTSRAYYRRLIERKLQNEDDIVSDDVIYWIHLTGIAPAFLLMAISALAFSVLNFVRVKAAFYATFIFFVILRSLLFSASISFVLIAFPIRFFGTVNGIVNTTGGIFSLLQYGIIELPAVPGNGLAIGIAAVLFVTPVILFCKRC